MEFKVTIPNLQAFLSMLADAPNIVAPILARALSASQAVLAANTVKGVVPWRTGFLTQSFRAELSDAVLRWFPTASYAQFVEFGTAPHLILPKKGQALMWPGAFHPVRAVQHPGTQANPFMERILAESTPGINDLFMQALGQITEQMAS